MMATLNCSGIASIIGNHFAVFATTERPIRKGRTMADPAPVYYVLRRNRKRRAESDSDIRADTAPNVVPSVVSIPSGSPPPRTVGMPSDTKSTTGGRTGGNNLVANPQPSVTRIETPPLVVIKPFVSDTQHTTSRPPAVTIDPSMPSQQGVMGGPNGLGGDEP